MLLRQGTYLPIMRRHATEACALVPLEIAICLSAADLRRDGAGEFHGYEIAKRLSDVADRRLLTAYGTLYRALGRLEKMGLLESRWEDPEIPRPREPAGAPTLCAHGRGRTHRSRGAARSHRRHGESAPAPPPARATSMTLAQRTRDDRQGLEALHRS